MSEEEGERNIEEQEAEIEEANELARNDGASSILVIRKGPRRQGSPCLMMR